MKYCPNVKNIFVKTQRLQLKEMVKMNSERTLTLELCLFYLTEMPESSPMDDSLNDITDVAPCRKRRHRHLQQLETQAKRAALDQRPRSR